MYNKPCIQRSMTPLEWSLIGFLSMIWGGSFFFVAIAVNELPPFTIVFLRLIIASFTLLIIMSMMGTRLPHGRRLWATFLALGLLNNVVPFTLIVWGQTQIASGTASILNAATPFFTVIVAHYFIAGERANKSRITGALTGFIGVAIMIGGSALNTLGLNTLAQLACLCAAFSYALAGVFGRRLIPNTISPIATAFGQVTASSLVLFPLTIAFDKPWTLAIPSAEITGAVISLAVLSTALAYVLYFRLLASAGPTNLLLVTFLIPISAIFLSNFIPGETLGARHVSGMLCIGLGLAAIDGRPLQSLKTALRRLRPNEESGG